MFPERLIEGHRAFVDGRFAGERSRYAYIPFGVGPHVCVGASLALTEILIAVAILAQRFRFRLAPGQRIEPVAWTTLRPLHGIMMTVEPRPESVPQSR